MLITKSKVRLDLFPIKEFDRGAPKFIEVCWYLVKIIFFLSSFPFPIFLKVFLLRVFGSKVGKGLVIKPRVNIHFPWKLSIGDNVWIGEEAFFLNFEKLSIGNNVCISQRAFLCGGNHDFRDPTMAYRNGPINLKDGCWIGASVFVGPNVSIGVDSILSAGSVVTKDVPNNVILKGNPASIVGQRWKINNK